MGEFFSDHRKPIDIGTWLKDKHEHSLIEQGNNLPVGVLHLVREFYNNPDEYNDLSNPKQPHVNQ